MPTPAVSTRPAGGARKAIEDAREAIGELLGANLEAARPDRVIFTSGGTEANNLAIFGLALARGTQPGEIITSAIEHPSVLAPLAHLESQGWTIRRVGVTPAGVVRVDQFAAVLNPQTRLATIMLGNNETGVLQPIDELAHLASAHGVPLHTDAVQGVGKLPVSLGRLGVAALSLAAHKFHGPVGVGALVVAGDAPLAPATLWRFSASRIAAGNRAGRARRRSAPVLELFAAEGPGAARPWRPCAIGWSRR